MRQPGPFLSDAEFLLRELHDYDTRNPDGMAAKLRAASPEPPELPGPDDLVVLGADATAAAAASAAAAP